MKKQTWIATTVIMASLALIPMQVAAQKIDCNKEYRSGKLYFSQYRDSKRKESPRGSRAGLSDATRTLLNKAIDRYAIAVEHCPLKDAEFRWNNGIALGEAGLIALAEAAVMPDSTEKARLYQEAIDLATQASGEFSAVPDTENGAKKKQLKMARENRLYFWTELYNGGLERAKEEDYEGAAEYMEAAIAMDPLDARTYRQGAIVLFNAGQKARAADMVKRALSLEIDPSNDARINIFNENKPKLEELQRALFSELGREASKRAEKTKDLGELQKALEYYNALVEGEPENPNHLYSRGLTHMTGGKITRDTDSTASVEHYRAAGIDLEKAAGMVSAEEDGGFHTSAVRAAMYAWRDAGDTDKAFSLNLLYACLDPMKAAAWRGLARTFVSKGDQDQGLAALMMSKALTGTDVPVDIAVTNATDDAKAAVAELGNPSLVKSYQEGENSITTFIWADHKIARHFILGIVQQTITWCE